MKLPSLLLLTALFRLARSQSFIDAISAFPQLSSFASFLNNNTTYAATLLNVTRSQTILVPSNSAFTEYRNVTGHSIESLGPDTVQRILQYHTLNATLKSGDLAGGAAAQRGVVVGTQLVDKRYNDRGKWGNSNIKSPGQVVYISPASAGKTRRSLELATRQGSATTTVGTGAGSSTTMNIIDGVWDGGIFQIVDHFLTLPTNCTDTMDDIGLKYLTTALNVVNETDEWNSFQGVTCLAPTTDIAQGTDASSLTTVLSSHTIRGPQYTTVMQDGQTFLSDANTTITVKIEKDGTVWFNDAKVVRGNVVANNGVIHVLDKHLDLDLQANE
ncbi:hypothetical protein FGG08_006415 [Glutinoglossum americanum]|uniref:FAS1 domain-containing protein n=1 Tax=Glutinoglossum americanum TaxID=1670608 RepID=A0A9P8KXI4_9PEZI|nr:hypothetical protein FGG08_006415 [Glutinoglossum americanum]